MAKSGISTGTHLVVGAGHGAALIDLTGKTIVRLNLGFNPHSFIQHPKDQFRFVAFEKWGFGAAEIDFETGLLRPIKHRKSQFYGHGFYHPETDSIFASRVDTTSGLGYLTGYDPKTYEVRHDFQVTPGGLHECHRAQDGTYIVTSSGINAQLSQTPREGQKVAPSSLVRVDISNEGKIVGELQIEDGHILGHFTITKKNQILALSSAGYFSSEETGNLYYSPDGVAPLKKVSLPPEIQSRAKGEMLSVALNGSQDKAAVTNPLGNTVILIDMNDGKFLSSINESWRGVAYDAATDRFIGSHPNIETTDTAFQKITEFNLLEDFIMNKKIEFTGAHSIIKSIQTSTDGT